MFIEDSKLPDDVVRKQYPEDRDALCCLECGLGWEFDPRVRAIGKPPYVLMEHRCKENGD